MSGELSVLNCGKGDIRIKLNKDNPIAYYAESFVGFMVPTDEVISHLILIRAKEEFFWRKANQHPAWSWEAGF